MLDEQLKGLQKTSRWYLVDCDLRGARLHSRLPWGQSYSFVLGQVDAVQNYRTDPRELCLSIGLGLLLKLAMVDAAASVFGARNLSPRAVLMVGMAGAAETLFSEQMPIRIIFPSFFISRL